VRTKDLSAESRFLPIDGSVRKRRVAARMTHFRTSHPLIVLIGSCFIVFGRTCFPSLIPNIDSKNVREMSLAGATAVLFPKFPGPRTPRATTQFFEPSVNIRHEIPATTSRLAPDRYKVLLAGRRSNAARHALATCNTRTLSHCAASLH
jgi:hypothetical protein